MVGVEVVVEVEVEVVVGVGVGVEVGVVVGVVRVPAEAVFPLTVYVLGVAVVLTVGALAQRDKLREDGATGPWWVWLLVAALAVSWPLLLLFGFLFLGAEAAYRTWTDT